MQDQSPACPNKHSYSSSVQTMPCPSLCPHPRLPHMQFMPFIQGPRNCLGQFFALLEARVILGALCREFNFRPVHPEHQGVTHPTVIPVGPVNGMRMYVD